MFYASINEWNCHQFIIVDKYKMVESKIAALSLKWPYLLRLNLESACVMLCGSTDPRNQLNQHGLIILNRSNMAASKMVASKMASLFCLASKQHFVHIFTLDRYIGRQHSSYVTSAGLMHLHAVLAAYIYLRWTFNYST